ncbi:MAG: hypothetical protein JWN86_4154 [Planctomycetota bacterium]|nr:hypothetical protein [Planctomycetota bacterium]
MLALPSELRPVREGLTGPPREEALRQSEEQFSHLVAGVTDYAIFLLDLHGHVRTWNIGAERLKGYTAQEIIGQHFSRFYPEDAIESAVPEKELQLAQAEGRCEVEGWRLRKDGSRFWANVVITAMKDEAGKLRGFLKITRDLTDRQKVEEALRQSEEQFRSLAEGMPHCVWVCDNQGNMQYQNQVWYAYTGTMPGDVHGLDWLAFCHPDDRSHLMEERAKALETDGLHVFDIEVRIRRHDGEYRWFRVTGLPIRDDKGVTIRWAGTCTEINEQRRLVDALRQSEERLRLLATAANDGLWDLDIATGRVWWNDAYDRWFGPRPPETGKSIDWWADRLHPEDSERVLRWLREAIAGEATRWVENYRLRRADGSYAYVVDRVLVQRDRLGKAVRAVGSMLDLTDLKEAEEALRESEQRLRERADELETVLRATPAAIWMSHDPQCHRITGNPASYELLKMPEGTNPSATADPEDLARRTYQEFRNGVPVPPHELPMQLAASKGVEVHNAEVTMVFKDGSLRHTYGNAVPLWNPDGSVRGSVGASVDITELKQAEDKLKDADRNKDEFLAMLAHELRNPLAPIQSSLELFRLAGSNDPKLERAKAIMERQVNHLVRLVDDLLDVSRITRGQITLQKAPVDLATIVANAVESSRPLIDARRHDLQISLPSEALPFDGDPTRLTQVVVNLLSNSSKYTPEGGHISIEARSDGNQAVIAVKDDGMGIAPDMLPKVFNLFSQAERSLDRSQGGLGIGLTLVHRLVALHGGTVTVNSAGLGQGSEFVVRLPLLAGRVSDETAGASNRQKAEGTSLTRRILVVDDMPEVAESLAMLLEYLGHVVRMAHDGQTALQLIEEFRPDVILLDIGMPGMDGYAVARQIRAQPSLRGIYLAALSGYGTESDRERSREAGFDAHLLKPVKLATLERTLASLTGH